MASIEILLTVRRLSFRAIDRVTRMLEGSRGAARRALRRVVRFVDDDPPSDFSGSDVVASVMERVMRRPSSSMAASLSAPLCLLCILLLLFLSVTLLPSLVGLRRLRAFDETSAKALGAFDGLDEPLLCPCLLLVARGMAAEAKCRNM